MRISGRFLVLILLYCESSPGSELSSNHEPKRTISHHVNGSTTPVTRTTSWNTHGYHVEHEYETKAFRKDVDQEGKGVTTTTVKGTRKEKRGHSRAKHNIKTPANNLDRIIKRLDNVRKSQLKNSDKNKGKKATYKELLNEGLKLMKDVSSKSQEYQSGKNDELMKDKTKHHSKGRSHKSTKNDELLKEKPKHNSKSKSHQSTRNDELLKNSRTKHRPKSKVHHSSMDDDVLKGRTKHLLNGNGHKSTKDDDLLKDRTKHSKGKRLSRKALKALREALLEHPFRTWKYNGRFESMSDLGIHEAQLHEFVDNRLNGRIKEKLDKVLKGENIHLAILGGSNSAGGGIQEDEGDTSGVFYRVISHWWRKTILPITGSHLKMRPIAMGGTASDFFQYCYGNYIQDNVDMIFLELSVNDLKQLPTNVNLSLPIEQLTRQLLMLPTRPALLYLNLFSGRTYYQGCVNLEDYGQNLLSDIYKITTFSWRDAVCPRTVGNYRTPLKSCSVVCKDGHHINLRGHAHISLMVINLFRDLLLKRIIRIHKRLIGVFEDKEDLPQPIFVQSPSKLIESPKCWTTLAPSTGKFKMKNSLNVDVMENFGFDYLHNVTIGKACKSPRYCRGDIYSGWTGKDVGAYLQLSFTVPALPHRARALSSWNAGRSVVFATRTCTHCGAAEVWLDDDYMNRKYVAAKSTFSQTLLEIIAFRAHPGFRTMSVKVVVPGDFTAVAVMVGPADGPY